MLIENGRTFVSTNAVQIFYLELGMQYANQTSNAKKALKIQNNAQNKCIQFFLILIILK